VRQPITVYANVPAMRNIYVDKAGFITKIVGNTDQNVAPRVFDDELNKPQPMTDSIMRQYQQFITQHGVLEAGKTYTLSHEAASVSTARQEKINTSLRLEFDQND
jgi:hypothetical protein